MEQVMSWNEMHRTLGGIAPNFGGLADRFAEVLRRAKERRRLSIKEMARLLNRTPKGVERILAGDSSPQLDAVLLACHHFDEVWAEFGHMAGRVAKQSDAERILDEITARLHDRRRDAL